MLGQRRGARRAAAHRHLAPARPVAPGVVNPVVAGHVRALQTDQERSDAPADTGRALAITITATQRSRARESSRRHQPAVARRLPRRRHAPRDRRQPDRFHDGSARLASTRYSSDLAGLRHPDHPRERPTPSTPARKAVRLAMAFREHFDARRADRPRRLPALRTRRDRRALVRAAAADRAHQGASVRSVTLYARRLIDDGLTDEAAVDARRAQMTEQLAGRARPLASPDDRTEREPAERMARDLESGQHARPDGQGADRALRRAARMCPRASRCIPSSAPQLERRRAAVRNGGIDWGHAESLAFSLAAGRRHRDPPDRPGHRARHVLASPSRAARRAHGRALRADAAPRTPPRRASRCTTRRSPRRHASASSTGTR